MWKKQTHKEGWIKVVKNVENTGFPRILGVYLILSYPHLNKYLGINYIINKCGKCKTYILHFRY